MFVDTAQNISCVASDSEDLYLLKELENACPPKDNVPSDQSLAQKGAMPNSDDALQPVTPHLTSQQSSTKQGARQLYHPVPHSDDALQPVTPHSTSQQSSTKQGARQPYPPVPNPDRLQPVTSQSKKKIQRFSHAYKVDVRPVPLKPKALKDPDVLRWRDLSTQEMRLEEELEQANASPNTEENVEKMLAISAKLSSIEEEKRSLENLLLQKDIDVLSVPDPEPLFAADENTESYEEVMRVLKARMHRAVLRGDQQEIVRIQQQLQEAKQEQMLKTLNKGSDNPTAPPLFSEQKKPSEDQEIPIARESDFGEKANHVRMKDDLTEDDAIPNLTENPLWQKSHARSVVVASSADAKAESSKWQRRT